MLFTRSSTIALLAAPLLAAAVAVPRGDQCNTGEIHCCNSVQQSDSSAVSLITGLLGIVLGPVTGQVGLGCSPLSVIGAGGNSCSAQPVCCTGNNFNGLVVVGCTPINVNL